MRRIVLAAALALTAAALAACGGGGENGDGSPARRGDGPFPVTIRHKFGTTEIPARPRRVVTVGYTDQDPVLALGVKPIGVREFLGGYDWRHRPWAQRALGGARTAIVGGEQIDFEAVAAQRPDLIVGLSSGMSEDDYERLSRIAPTIAQPARYVDFGMPWQEQTLTIGRALGLEQRARRLVARVQDAFARARAEHPELVGATAVLAYGGPDGYGAYSSQDTRSRFFADLGMKTPHAIDELAGKAFYVQLSRERFRLLDRDVVVMFGSRADVLADPVFRRLRAVREDRVIYLDLQDQFAGALGFSSVLSLPYLLREALPLLSAAVDGRTSTPVRQPS